MVGKKDPRGDQPDPKRRAQDATCSPCHSRLQCLKTRRKLRSAAPTLLANWLRSLGRLGGSFAFQDKDLAPA
jgi:hypothetical protein